MSATLAEWALLDRLETWEHAGADYPYITAEGSVCFIDMQIHLGRMSKPPYAALNELIREWCGRHYGGAPPQVTFEDGPEGCLTMRVRIQRERRPKGAE